MITIITKRLDRVALVCRYQSADGNSYYKGVLGMFKDDVKSGGGLKQFSKGHSTNFYQPYGGKTWGTGVSYSFFPVQGCSAISIHFTPSMLAEADWLDFLSVLECNFNHGAKEVWDTFRVSKLEIAMDVKVPFSEVLSFAPKITEINISYLKSGTLYLGHRFGKRSYCIYDKRKQVFEQKQVELDHDRTRIEVRHRHLGKTLGQLDGMAEPFGRLIAIRKLALVRLMQQRPLDFELKAFVKSILAGYPSQLAYLDLDSYTRKRITKLVRPRALQLNSEKLGWQQWFAQQQHDLQTRFLG